MFQTPRKKKREMVLEDMLKSLSLADKTVISLVETEKDYVLDMACQKSSGEDSSIAATSSNRTIRLYKKSNLVPTATVKGHKDTVTGICWGNKDTDVFFTSSTDQSIRAWDIRTKMNKAIQKFEGADESNNLFTCVDINASDQLLSAGLEQDKSENAFILFWDRRNTELQGCYSQSHQDDITQVCFHPDNPDRLSSGSMDGLVSIFDVSEGNEDDALSLSMNSCATVAKIGWCGRNLQNIYCTTHMDTVHVWDSDEGDPVLEITDLKDSLKDSNSIDYVVDCISWSEENTLTVVAGCHNGDIRIVECSTGTQDEPRVIQTLSKGHRATVRCCHWDSQNESMITGAEDSMLCSWTCNTTDFSDSKSVKVKTRKGKKRSVPY